MVIDIGNILQAILSVVLFPTTFEDAFLAFSWGADDVVWLMIAKRLFLILPTCAFIAACWVTIPSLVTTIFRSKRREFIIAMFVTWWDLGKSVVSFWGGFFLFVLNCLGAIVGLVRIILFSLWWFIREILLSPFRLIKRAGVSVTTAGVPWIAIVLTLFWCVIEAVIFTYVTTPLVSDTLSNITGEQLSVGVLRIPLFIFLFFVVMGSYAVLSSLVNAFKTKRLTGILGILVIELIVMSVEVVFLYREFVDSLVPWFAQYSQGFELGIIWTLAIACFAWFGIRSISWFLFAEHGTPWIMAVIQGKGLGTSDAQEQGKTKVVSSPREFMDTVKEDSAWIKAKGEELLASFMLPPLQVAGATINFCALLVNGRHLFDLPFTSLESIVNKKPLLEAKKKVKGETVQQA
jgi:hypothetical protein